MSHKFQSEYFDVQELAPGVYAAVAFPDRVIFSNAGIVDLGDTTLVVDTFNAPQAGASLYNAAVELTGRPPSLVINTHAHGDHWHGNQAFAGIPIISTTAARQSMEKFLPLLAGQRKDTSILEQGIHDLQHQLETETDPRVRPALQTTLARRRFELENLFMLEPRLPDQAFEGELAFHGKTRRAVLTSRGPAHSPGDAVLALPEDAIAFIGDLGFFQAQPYMGDCHPTAWQARLEELARPPYTIFVPGHGPVGGKADLHLLAQYIAWISERLTQARQAGSTPEEVIAAGLPEPFQAWMVGGMSRFEMNVRTLLAK